MSEFFPSKGLLEDPAFLLLGAVSLVFLLVVLYRGAWRYVTGILLGLVNTAILGVWFYTILLAFIEYVGVLTGPPGRKAVSLVWALIMTAFAAVIPYVFGLLNSDDSRLGRFLKQCKPEQYR